MKMLKNSTWLLGAVILLLSAPFWPGCRSSQPEDHRPVAEFVNVVQVKTDDVVGEKHDGWWLVSPYLMSKLYELARDGKLRDGEGEIPDSD